MNSLNDLRSYTRRWLKEFIEIYRNEACLWQAKHPEYNNNSLRSKAYEKLIDKLREVETEPDRHMVVRKINSLRSAFRRELRKKRSSKSYHTRLWYFDLLQFIADQKYPATQKCFTKSSVQDSSDQNFSDLDEDADGTTQYEEISIVDDKDPIKLSPSPTTTSETVVQQHQQSFDETQEDQERTLLQRVGPQTTNTTVPNLTAQTDLTTDTAETFSPRDRINIIHSAPYFKPQEFVKFLPTIQSTVQHPNSTTFTGLEHQHSHIRTINDEFDAIGTNVASKLRFMKPTQRIIAEKLISDVLFNGQLDSLAVNSQILINNLER